MTRDVLLVLSGVHFERQDSAPTRLLNMAEADFEKAETYTGPEIQLSADKEAQYAQIMRNLQEATSTEIVRKVLSDGETVRCYWGKQQPWRFLN